MNFKCRYTSDICRLIVYILILSALDSSYDVSLRVDDADLYFVNTTEYGSDGFVFHTYNLSQPYRPVLVSVYPTSVNQSLNVYVQFDEQPTADVYEYQVQVHVTYMYNNMCHIHIDVI